MTIDFLKKHPLLLYMLLISAVKMILVSNLPIYILYAPHDDGLMINTAASMLRFDWLGNYSEMTLVKGPFFPLFLAVSKLFSIPYLLSASLFYLLGCYLFVYAIKDVFNSKIYLAVLFTALAFNPISFDLSAFQRVYRGSMGPAQVLIIAACLFAVYLRREQSIRKLLPWLIIAGLALASLWLTREDGIWILPFVLGCIIVTAVSLIHGYVKNQKRINVAKAGLCLLPVLILWFVILVVSALNYAWYGIFTTNELNGSHFSKAMKSIYSVQPSEDIDYVSVPRSTVYKLYEISPSMMSIKPYLEPSLDGWEVHGKVTGDGQVEDGWFFWCLRSAVSGAGYYSDARIANTFYIEVHQEIEQALDEGRILRRPVMPSALMSPLKIGYDEKLFVSSIDAIRYVASYQDVSPHLAESAGDDFERNRHFEYLTGNFGLYPNSVSSAQIAGGIERLWKIDKAIVYGYQKAGTPTLLLGLCAFVFITIMMAMRHQKEKHRFFEIWLMLLALILNVLVLVLGVSYTHISAYHAINTLYLSAAYPLLSAFSLLAILYSVQYLISFIIKGKRSNGESSQQNI